MVLSALLLAFDDVRAALFHVDLAAFDLVQLNHKQIHLSNIKMLSSIPSKRHNCYHQNMVEHLKIETGLSQTRSRIALR